MPLPVKYSDLARNTTLRGSGSGPKKWSANDRWLLARMTGPRRGTFLPPARPGPEHQPQRDAQRVLSYPVEHGYIVARPRFGGCRGRKWYSSIGVGTVPLLRLASRPPVRGRDSMGRSEVSSLSPSEPPSAEPFSADGGPVGVLVLHGFTGAPRTVRPWAAHLAAAGLTVRAPLLAGHGARPGRSSPRRAGPTGTPTPSARSTELYARCAQVFVAGHLDGRLPGVAAGGDAGRRGSAAWSW